jgi:hypothetical protein
MPKGESKAGAAGAANIGAAGVKVKEGIVSSLKGINEIEAEIVSLVRNTVSDALKATASVANDGIIVSKDVVKGAIQATEEVGCGTGTKGASQAGRRTVKNWEIYTGQCFHSMFWLSADFRSSTATLAKEGSSFGANGSCCTQSRETN